MERVSQEELGVVPILKGLTLVNVKERYSDADKRRW